MVAGVWGRVAKNARARRPFFIMTVALEVDGRVL